MKRINQYKKLFNVESDIDLAQLKKTYRSLVKEWHPDKFQEQDEKAAMAEEKSREITQGYEFLISIAPETKKNNAEEYQNLMNTGAIVDFQWKNQVLEVEFTNGSTYEYFGVSKPLYIKFVNADKQFRFGKRKIFTTCLYRKSKRDVVA
ncbi:KTSC domain-containing protein [Brumimicrobium aurantiacum]|uniref:KTSC domain-containing protein n=1 Tax=Brumimicrobium aurantiacum TaxID=1737063 RepID=A0A3E1F042_9FLAO|nr:KTSC domain-containing protein [Brumimicrobium aurantiacum]RFC55093.1 KTSC domain-containing protein [Brumimicrobium aurantiacum]